LSSLVFQYSPDPQANRDRALKFHRKPRRRAAPAAQFRVTTRSGTMVARYGAQVSH
jgi:hypothetical protein